MGWTTTASIFIVLFPVAHACGRNKPPRDHTPPNLQCPPDRLNEIADPIQDHTKVSWIEPSATDEFEGKAISPSRDGLGPGKLFSEGSSVIKYIARDGSGNSASCSFKIQVKVIRCRKWDKQTDGWKICHTSDDMRLGTTCRFGCYDGHKLHGPARAECKSTGSWDIGNQPRCKAITCEQLIPKPDQVGVVNIQCTNGNRYRSICTYRCIDGYSVEPGHSKVRVCGADGYWVGVTPYCKDIRPPEFTNCPWVVIAYADKLKSFGKATWDEPTVTDNSGISLRPIQTVGPSRGSEIKVGEYDVTYMVKDGAGNTATCQFKVNMKQVKCHTIYPLPYTTVTCLDGRIYGATCRFACEAGANSTFPMETECKKNGTVFSYGFWDFENHQPYCERKNLCPDLRPPDNGALACDLWQYGRFCFQFCQQGYTIVNNRLATHHVCTDTGIWRPTDQVSDCAQAGRQRGTRVDGRFSLDSYNGPCQEAREEIQTKFIQRFQEKWVCAPPGCVVSNVKVICGDTVKRSTYSQIDVVVTFDIAENLTYHETVQQREALKQAMVEAQMNGSLDVTVGNQTLAAASVDVSPLQTLCEEGSIPDIDRPLTCVECGLGYYQDTAAEPSVCRKCERGFFQNATGQTACMPCPPGMTTEDEGAKECQEACMPGFYSATGTSPCDPCDIGYYTDVQGTRSECTPCPGSATTSEMGTRSVDGCFDFDLQFYNMSDVNDTEPAVVTINTTDATELSLTMWFRCSSCENLISLTASDSDGESVTIGGEPPFTITSASSVFTEDSVNLTSSNWRHLYVTWSPPSCQLFIDGAMVANVSFHSAVLPPSLNISVGGSGFIGAVSQLNMYSYPAITLTYGLSELSANYHISTNDSSEYPPNHNYSTTTSNSSDPSLYYNVSDPTLPPLFSDPDPFPSYAFPLDTCMSNMTGDLLSWKQMADLDGTFVIAKSVCDAFDNCLSSPCQNSGVCFDEMDGYKCACAAGFSGNNCSINIDDCVASSCDNGGTCVDKVDGFECDCPAGFRGELCEIRMIDGGWSPYGQWSLCSVTCGQGEQVRYRTCDRPEPNNGGRDCQGPNIQIRECQLQECINECIVDLSLIVNGTLNCEWDSKNETRRCFPKCDEGYDFDSDLFVDPPNVYCGPETGYIWNIRSSENPDALLPSCMEKKTGETNILNFTAAYGDMYETNENLTDDVIRVVSDRVANTTCVTQGHCNHTDTYVELRNNVSSDVINKTSYVTFTAKISCKIVKNMDECYDFLKSLVLEMNDFIEERALTVNHSGHSYDVIANSTQLGGTTDCGEGYVPVVHYCIECGEGMYQSGQFCERCPVGFYQNRTAQSACTACPKGWTTRGLQANHIMQCSVRIEPSYTLFYAALFIGLALTLVVATVAFFGDSSALRYYLFK